MRQGQRSPSPVYLPIDWQPDQDSRLEERKAERLRVQHEIESYGSDDQTETLKQQKLLLEHPVEEEDSEKVQARDADPETA